MWFFICIKSFKPVKSTSASPVQISRSPGFEAAKVPEGQNTIIECPVLDCKMHIKFSSLNIHFSRKHPAAFYHFKKSDFDVFTIRCTVCGFGYYNHLHYQHSHRDCSLQNEARFREKVFYFTFHFLTLKLSGFDFFNDTTSKIQKSLVSRL